MSKKCTKKERSFAERLTRSLDITPDVLPHGTLISLRGRNALNVSGCGRILVYTPEQIKIALHRDVLLISGHRLLCTSYHRGEVGIEGVIDSVSFSAKEGK